jgi:peptide methionine sulfoxide reductase MsrA
MPKFKISGWHREDLREEGTDDPYEAERLFHEFKIEHRIDITILYNRKKISLEELTNIMWNKADPSKGSAA